MGEDTTIALLFLIRTPENATNVPRTIRKRQPLKRDKHSRRRQGNHNFSFIGVERYKQYSKTIGGNSLRETI
jgi:hypothetical protein